MNLADLEAGITKAKAEVLELHYSHAQISHGRGRGGGGGGAALWANGVAPQRGDRVLGVGNIAGKPAADGSVRVRSGGRSTTYRPGQLKKTSGQSFSSSGRRVNNWTESGSKAAIDPGMAM